MSGFRVVLVGPSGAGKTSVAARISSHKADVQWVEISRDLIERREYQDTGHFAADRQRGFDYFRRMKDVEGPAWVARRLQDNYSDLRDLLVTGVRGVENVKALKDVGFYCVFVTASERSLVERVSKRHRVDPGVAANYLEVEAKFYHYAEIADVCDIALDTTAMTEESVEAAIANICISISEKERISLDSGFCTTCVNSRRNNALFSRGLGTCDICDEYERAAHSTNEAQAVAQIIDECRRDPQRPIALGYSGGKDSHVAALYLRDRVPNLRLFTVNTGYYPITMLERAKRGAVKLGLEHEVVDAREQITDCMRASYQRTATLFDELVASPSKYTQDELYGLYLESRQHYSAKDDVSSLFPRICVLCRKAVIRSYYGYARRAGVKYVFLGINEWAALSKSAVRVGSVGQFSGIRRIAPYADGQEIFIIHLPFVMDASLAKNTDILTSNGWIRPFGEHMVETNANSCLLAKVTERAFYQKLGFHPDSTRLGREVTVGFLRRGEALDALSRLSRVQWTATEVLRFSGILR